MNTGVISVRYAKALLAYATEQGVEDAVYDSMKQLVEVIREVKEFAVLLRNPRLEPLRRVEIICSVMPSSHVVRRFVELVVKAEREDMLVFMAHEYMTLYRKKKGICAVKFTTAVPMDEITETGIRNMLEGVESCKVEIEYRDDVSLIGGFRMEMDSRRIDASIQGQLGRIRKKIVKQNRKLV